MKKHAFSTALVVSCGPIGDPRRCAGRLNLLHNGCRANLYPYATVAELSEAHLANPDLVIVGLDRRTAPLLLGWLMGMPFRAPIELVVQPDWGQELHDLVHEYRLADDVYLRDLTKATVAEELWYLTKLFLDQPDEFMLELQRVG